jgi:hypothetical protein
VSIASGCARHGSSLDRRNALKMHLLTGAPKNLREKLNRFSADARR